MGAFSGQQSDKALINFQEEQQVRFVCRHLRILPKMEPSGQFNTDAASKCPFFS